MASKQTRPPILRAGRKDSSPLLSLADVIGQVAGSSALRDADQALRTDHKLTIEGVWLGAVPPIVAAWTRMVRRPVLLIVPHFAEAEAVASELSELTDLPVEVFPPGSEDNELESLAQQETAQRLHVLSQLYKYGQFQRGSPDNTAGNGSSDGHQHKFRKGPIGSDAVHPADDTPRLPPIVVTTLPSIQHHVPGPSSLEGDKRVIWVGGSLDLTATRDWLIEVGYHPTSSVQLPGEFAVRGGILDIFPPDEAMPIRVELFDEEVESLRSFDVVTQRSIENRQVLHLLAAKGSVLQDGSLMDYLSQDCLTLVYEPSSVQTAAEAFLHRVPFPERYRSPASVWQELTQRDVVYAAQLAADGYLGQLKRLPIGNVERIGGDLERLAADIDQHVAERPVIVVAFNEGERERLTDLLSGSQAKLQQRMWIIVSHLQNGFELLPDGPFVLTASQLLRRSHVRRETKRHHSRPIDNFLELRPGDLVVHLSHGIGVYRGTELLEKSGQRAEHLVIEFDAGTKLYVPSTKIELIQRYVGGTKSRPKLAKIGGLSWAKQKKAAERAVQDMAVELLELQARRRSQPGVAFAADSVWQNQFDASFSYVETPDQLRAIAAVKQDMV